MAVPSLSQPYEWTFRRVVWATLVLAFVVFCFWLLFRFYEVVFILFVAIVIGTVVRPATNWLSQRGLSRLASVLLVYLLILLLFVGFLWMLFPLIFQQGAAVLGDVPGYYQSLRVWLINSPNPMLERLGLLLPIGTPGLSAVPQTDPGVLTPAEMALQYVRTTAWIIFAAIVIPAMTLYWTLDGQRLIRSLLLLIPQDQRESMSDLISAMEASVGRYLIAQGLLCLAIGAMALVAYLLIGLPNALVLAIIAGVLEAVPMIGPALGAIPAGLVALSIGTDKLIWVIVATTIIQQIENSLLVPRVMKQTVGVNPFVTLLALFAFSSLFGIAGALMAIPLAAIIQLVLNHFVFQPTTVELDASEGRDYSSRLRYEAQELIQDLRKQARHRKEETDEKIVQVDHVMDEIETITENLDSLLAQTNHSEEA